MKLLEKDPNKRPAAGQLMNHHWFINFTSRQVQHKQGNNNNVSDVMSLRTIIESSELSEREIDSGSRMGLFNKKLSKKSLQEVEKCDTINDNYSSSNSSHISDEDNNV